MSSLKDALTKNFDFICDSGILTIMKSVELFSGAGGLGIGLHAAGFTPQKVVEWDKHCCETIRGNQSRKISPVTEWPLVEGDIRTINFSEFEDKLDLVSGGPPCQPFSLGGRHKAHKDARDMFPEAIRVVRETRPRAFLFENVKGLTRESFRSYFEYIRLQLTHPDIHMLEGEGWPDHLARLEDHHTSGQREDLHYRVVAQVLNSANYGVPQRRERVFFIGFRDDLNVAWHFPKATHSRDALLWEQFVSGDYWHRNRVARKCRSHDSRSEVRAKQLCKKPDILPWVTTREAIKDLPPPALYYPQKYPDHKFQPNAKIYPGHTGSPLDEPAKTIKAGVHGVPGGENMLRKANGDVRYFSVRESARLQTFPDDFTFRGSWTESMRQLGNAVPVKLAMYLAKDIANSLESKNG